MTTINTLDDFLQAQGANPSWREAVRARILGEELLQLPVRFEAFAQEQKTWNTNVEARLNRIEGDMSGLKGDYARTRAIQDARGIAEDRGLEYVRTLTNDDLNGMARGNLDRDVLRSFRNADLVIEATYGTASRFIAMEISYTADQRDCSRAIRNAELITRFTGGTGLGSHRQRQKRPGSGSSGGIRSRVLAPAGGPDSGPGVTRWKQAQSPSPENTPELPGMRADPLIWYKGPGQFGAVRPFKPNGVWYRMAPPRKNTVNRLDLGHHPAESNPLPKGIFPFAAEYVWRPRASKEMDPTKTDPTCTLNTVLGLPDWWRGGVLVMRPFLNQYQGGMCISGVSKTTARTPRYLIMTFRHRIRVHRQCGLAICTFHLGFSLVPFSCILEANPAIQSDL